jgi:hypothetical protein
MGEVRPVYRVNTAPEIRGEASAVCSQMIVGFGSWLCKNAAALNGDRTEVSLNGIWLPDGLSVCSISADSRKSILAVSHVAEFSHSQDH